MKNFISTITIVLVFSGILLPQVSCNLTIQNQTVSGTDFLFDLYITSTGTNDIYLGNADFVLTFNIANFTSPTITKEGVSPGYCTFTPTDVSGFNTLFTQDLYYNNTSVSILHGNEITINLNGPTPSDQTAFNGRVAKINNAPNRLGRFRISGITNPAGYMNLQWKTIVSGVYTHLRTMATFDPWLESQISITATNPLNEPLPVELTSLTVNATNKKVILNWQTATEVNNYGFEIHRQTGASTGSATDWEKVGFVAGNGNSNSEKSYSFSDDLTLNQTLTLNNLALKLQYRLKQIDNDGTFGFSKVVEVEIKNIPSEFALEQNYPNPFNPTTTIKYSLPVKTNIKLSVYNSLGEIVAELYNGEKQEGYHEVKFNSSNLSSGIYFYRIESEQFNATKKMILLK